MLALLWYARFFYPKPKKLPPVVSEKVEQLLARLQVVIDTNAPAVARNLQPGLSDAQITDLEAKGGFRLSDDLRAFYRWHDGMTTNTTLGLGLLPCQWFVPLERCVAERELMKQQRNQESLLKRAASAVFIGHLESWVQILDDGAGDGYFYDPERREDEGAFFYHFAETRNYIWFPSFRNYLSGVIECYETRCVWMAADGKSLEEDFTQTSKIWQRLGEEIEIE